MFRAGAVCQTPTRASGCQYGNGLSRIPLTTLNMAVLAPTPMPTVRMVTAVKVGECLSRRNTCEKRIFIAKNYYAARQPKFALFYLTMASLRGWHSRLVLGRVTWHHARAQSTEHCAPSAEWSGKGWPRPGV